MKRIPFTILILISFIYTSQAQNTNSFNQDSTTNFKTPPYKLAAGIRLPLYGIMIDPGISAKYFLGKKMAMEASIGWNIALQDLTVALFATRNHQIFRQNNLRLLYGLGISGLSTEANMRTLLDDNKEHFYVGAGITAGLVYPLKKKPFVFGAEYRQVFYKFTGQDRYSKNYINTTFGLTAKYIIR